MIIKACVISSVTPNCAKIQLRTDYRNANDSDFQDH